MRRAVYNCALVLFVLTSLLSCSKTSKFTIDGELTNGAEEKIFLEQTSLSGDIVLDSAKLSKRGTFSFKHKSPEYPDIYHLRIGSSRFVFCIDTTEHITIRGDVANLSKINDIEGSDATRQIAELRRSLVENSAEQHRELQKQIILANPKSIVAYFALHQTKNGTYLLSPYNQDDMVYYRAVATAFNTFMPNYYRSKALYGQVLSIINAQKTEIANAQIRQLISESENAFLEISLPDENGEIRKLSDHKGKFVVLDFSAIAMEGSTAYIFQLKEIYNKYHSKGVDIYQVSADNNRLLWQQSAKNLPWTTVRSETGLYDDCFISYNVQMLPTLFLLDKKGNPVGRYGSFRDLRESIEKCLR